jgi:hypothetical protein
MIETRPRRIRPGLTAAYAGLCAIMVAVGWIAASVTVLPVQAVAAPPSSVAAATSLPTRPPTARPTVAVTAAPTDTPVPLDSLVAGETPLSSPTKVPFSIDLYQPGTFISQMTREYCMAGAVQNMVNIIGPKVDLTTARQQQIGDLLVSLTTSADSYDGGFGPNGWALAMPKLGAGQYKMIIDTTFDAAMRDAALALARTGRPVGLLTWWGAHSWVMTGFKADSDPLLFPTTFTLKGAYIVDPFYPRVSNIWGQTLGPDTFRDMTAMAHNYIGWKRPEGHYPDRDGKWLLVIPTDG